MLINIDDNIINFLRISYLCPSCHKQVILTPDIGDKEYFSCGECHGSYHVRGNQFHYIQEMRDVFDFARKVLNKNGLQVWIEGQPDPSTFAHGSTTLKRTYYKPFFQK
jgi:DNA-directed RNA polymerase subunit RPC12/RpoP